MRNHFHVGPIMPWLKRVGLALTIGVAPGFALWFLPFVAIMFSFQVVLGVDPEPALDYWSRVFHPRWWREFDQLMGLAKPPDA